MPYLSCFLSNIYQNVRLPLKSNMAVFGASSCLNAPDSQTFHLIPLIFKKTSLCRHGRRQQRMMNSSPSSGDKQGSMSSYAFLKSSSSLMCRQLGYIQSEGESQGEVLQLGPLCLSSRLSLLLSAWALLTVQTRYFKEPTAQKYSSGCFKPGFSCMDMYLSFSPSC